MIHAKMHTVSFVDETGVGEARLNREIGGKEPADALFVNTGRDTISRGFRDGGLPRARVER